MDERPPIPARSLYALAIVAVASLALLAYRSVLALPLLGYDSYPMIIAARIQSLGDLFGTFTEELMDGRYTDGHFYRPVANLSFALDHALWGLTPRGYHATDVAILVANGVLLLAVARRIFSERLVLGGLVAALVFVVHPVQLEVLPTAPRRADTLCLAFLLACIVAQPEAGRALGRRGVALSALFALLAAGAKETGAIVAPIVLSLHLVEGSGAAVDRVRAAVARSLPAIGAVAFFVVVRTTVLGGFGGHAESAVGGLRSIPDLVEPYVKRVFYPQPFLGDIQSERALIVVAPLALLLLAITLVRRPGPGVEPRRVRGGLVFLAAWIVCLFGITSLSGRVHDWYAMLFVAPYALVLGFVVDRGLAVLRLGRWPVAAPALAVAGLLAVSHVGMSPLAKSYPRLEDAGKLLTETLDRTGRLIEPALPGTVVRLNPFVPMIPPRLDGTDVRSLFLMSDYSLQAYTDLVFPEKNVRVVLFRPTESEEAGVVKLVIVPAPPPSWIR